MIKVNIEISLSKILAYIILILGSIYSFYTKESEVMIFAFSLSAGLMGLKSWDAGVTTRKQIESNTCKPNEEVSHLGSGINTNLAKEL